MTRDWKTRKRRNISMAFTWWISRKTRKMMNMMVITSWSTFLSWAIMRNSSRNKASYSLQSGWFLPTKMVMFLLFHLRRRKLLRRGSCTSISWRKWGRRSILKIWAKRRKKQSNRLFKRPWRSIYHRIRLAASMLCAWKLRKWLMRGSPSAPQKLDQAQLNH